MEVHRLLRLSGGRELGFAALVTFVVQLSAKLSGCHRACRWSGLCGGFPEVTIPAPSVSRLSTSCASLGRLTERCCLSYDSCEIPIQKGQGVESFFFHFLVLLVKIIPAVSLSRGTGCTCSSPRSQDLMALRAEVASIVSDSEAYLIGSGLLLIDFGDLGNSHSLRSEFETSHALDDIGETLRILNGRLDPVFEGQQHIIQLVEIVRELLIIEILALKILGDPDLKQKQDVEYDVSVPTILKHHMLDLFGRQRRSLELV